MPLVIWFNLQCKKVQVEYCITISLGVYRQELHLHAFCFVWIFFELEMRMDMSSIERSLEKRSLLGEGVLVKLSSSLFSCTITLAGLKIVGMLECFILTGFPLDACLGHCSMNYVFYQDCD